MTQNLKLLVAPFVVLLMRFLYRKDVKIDNRFLDPGVLFCKQSSAPSCPVRPGGGAWEPGLRKRRGLAELGLQVP